MNKFKLLVFLPIISGYVRVDTDTKNNMDLTVTSRDSTPAYVHNVKPKVINPIYKCPKREKHYENDRILEIKPTNKYPIKPKPFIFKRIIEIVRNLPRYTKR